MRAVLILLALLVGLWLMEAYNSLVRLRQAGKNAWAQIDLQLKRRHDLSPNLVNTGPRLRNPRKRDARNCD